ncbi:CUB domain-containing protein [Bdellovibrio bacteriovorus]|uniref:CUB domain-containing protein n=1 Tax=Bdellovibrio TaxID=958 RepID=UPI0035A8E19D
MACTGTSWLSTFAVVLFLSLLNSGCGLSAHLEDLLQSESPVVSINDKTPFLIVNATNKNSFQVSGKCNPDSGDLRVLLNEVDLSITSCTENGTWSATYDMSSIADGNATLSINQNSADATLSEFDSANVLKDTVIPQIAGLNDVLIPTNSVDFNWNCLDPADNCQFRYMITDNPVHIFIAELFSVTQNASIIEKGHNYLYVQAQDRAGNLSTPVRVDAYVGAPKIFIGGLQTATTLSGTENLYIFAAPTLSEMSLFNNATCTGAPTWQSTNSVVSNWSLDPASQGGTASVSVRFRTSAGVESDCYTDSILWLNPTLHTMCTDTTSSAGLGRVVDSGGTGGNYSDNENCTLNLTLTGPTTFTFETANTESGYDYLTMYDGVTQVLGYSGAAGISPITTTSNNVRIEFSSDSSVTEPGFSILWVAAGGPAPSLSLNNGASSSISATVTANLNYDSIFQDVYLTETAACASGGTWTSLASQLPWTFSNATNGTKILYVKFRDAFGNETACENDDITLVLPQITIDAPGAGSAPNLSLDLAGTCSAPGLNVEISGTFSGTTACLNDNTWAKSFDTSALPNNTTINITARLMNGATVAASATGTWTLDRQISITSPAAGAFIGPNYTVSGTCNVQGATIEVTTPSVTATSCNAGTWSVNLTSGAADGTTINFSARMMLNSVEQDSDSRNFVLSTLPPIAVINGAPTGSSIEASVIVNISGTNVGSYKYKFGSAANCSDSAGYSAEINAATSLTLNQSALPNGSVTLCVVGKSSINGLWQDYANATTATWMKDSNVDVNISGFNLSVTEGASNLQLTVTLSGTKLSDVRVYYYLLGNALYMVDHDLAPGYITIPAGSLTASKTFNTFGNALADSDREMRIVLTHTDSAAANISYVYQKTVVIKDDDQVYQTIVKYSGSQYNNCAIWSNGRLRCWGTSNIYGGLGTGNTNDVTTVVEPSPADQFMDVSVSDYYTCAITSLKKLKCWGYNYYGQLGNGNTTNVYSPTDIDSGENYVSIRTGGAATCGLTESGKIKCWGANTSGQLGLGHTNVQLTPATVDSANTYSFLSFNGSAGCGITSLGGNLRCWGYNGYEQVLSGTTTSQTAPVDTDPGTAYKFVETGSTICGITLTDTLKCWGSNFKGQVGNGGTSTVTSRHVVDSGTSYKFIDLAGDYTCGITSTDDLKCWGEVRGTFTFQQANQKNVPTLVGDGVKYSASSFSPYGGCAIGTDGDLYCMGDFYNRQFHPVQGPEMVDFDPSTTFSAYSVGSVNMCGIRTDGTVLCAGTYAGSSVYRNVANVIAQGASHAGGSVALSESGGCVINATGNMKCAGSNGFGAVGDGTTTTPGPFVNVAPSISFATTIREQYYCAAGIDTSGKLYVWGQGGGLGCGTATISNTPLATDTATTYKPFLAEGGAFCSITTNDDLKCWGYDGGTGELGGTSKTDPTLMDSGTKYKTVSLSVSTLCGITLGDKLRCWGSGTKGRLANGGTSNSSTPTTVDAASDYSDISVGSNSVCAITAGTLKCWGYVGDFNSNATYTTQQVVNSGTSYQKVAAGNTVIMALTSSGQLHYWPKGRFDQAHTVVAPSKTFKSLKGHASGNNFCALTTDDHLYCFAGNWMAHKSAIPVMMTLGRFTL